MYTFGGVAATPLLIIGQLINLSGGTIYTWEKYRFDRVPCSPTKCSEYNKNDNNRHRQHLPRLKRPQHNLQKSPISINSLVQTATFNHSWCKIRVLSASPHYSTNIIFIQYHTKPVFLVIKISLHISHTLNNHFAKILRRSSTRIVFTVSTHHALGDR